MHSFCQTTWYQKLYYFNLYNSTTTAKKRFSSLETSMLFIQKVAIKKLYKLE
jgi:hypothetical protein